MLFSVFKLKQIYVVERFCLISVNADLALLHSTPIFVWLVKSIALSHLEVHLWPFSWPDHDAAVEPRKYPCQPGAWVKSFYGVGVKGAKEVVGESYCFPRYVLFIIRKIPSFQCTVSWVYYSIENTWFCI